jgi:hypothetical protein
VAGLQQRVGHVGADEASTAGDKDAHVINGNRAVPCHGGVATAVRIPLQLQRSSCARMCVLRCRC